MAITLTFKDPETGQTYTVTPPPGTKPEDYGDLAVHVLDSAALQRAANTAATPEPGQSTGQAIMQGAGEGLGEVGQDIVRGYPLLGPAAGAAVKTWPGLM